MLLEKPKHRTCGRQFLSAFAALISRLVQHNARIGRNPRTGKVVPVDEKVVPFFRTSKALHVRLNRGGMQRRT